MLTRRSFLAVAAVGATALLAGCASEPEPEPQAQGEPTVTDESAADTGGNADAGTTPAGATLVAYFSATGNTEGMATAIAEHLDADVFVIAPAQSYTEADLNYNDDASRTSIEHASDAQPDLSQITPESWDSCATVFLGYPIWWGEAGFPVKTFATGNDFTGKTVVPFCTSASSGIGASGEELERLAGTGNWLEGERFSSSTPTADVADWVDTLAL